MPQSAQLLSMLLAARAAPVPHWLIALGAPGLFLVSFLDASVIPLPIPGSSDLLLLLLCARHGSHAMLLAAGTMAASVAGGYLTHSAGKKGGEAMLQHYTPKRIIQPVTRWVKSNGMLTIAISAVLPPPVPLLPLLLGAGALGTSKRQFFVAFTGGRILRYGVIAAIGATYGRRVLHWWQLYLADWTAPILWAFFGILAAGIVFGFWQWRRQKRTMAAQNKTAGNPAPAA